MPIQLKNVEISFISYVDKGANKRKFFLIKSEDKDSIEKKVQIVKKEEDEQLVYGVVYEPNVEDTHGHFMDEESIKKMAHRFMDEYQHIDEQHNQLSGAGTVVESWIAPADMEINGEQVKKGSWVLVTKASDEIWDKIKESEYTGYSMFGFAQDTEEVDIENQEIKQDDKGFISKIVDGITNAFKLNKDFNRALESDKNNDIWQPFRILEGEIYNILWSDSENVKEKIVKSINQFKEHIETMEFDLFKSEKGKKEVEMKKEELEELLKTEEGRKMIEGVLKEKAEKEKVKKEKVEKEEEKGKEVEKEEDKKEKDEEVEKGKDIEKDEKIVSKVEEIVGKLVKGFNDDVKKLKSDLKSVNESIDKLNKSNLNSKGTPSDDDKPKKVENNSKMM